MKLSKSFTVQDASALLGIKYIGSPGQVISGLNEIHKVEEGDLTFVDVDKYYSKALKSAASVILINSTVEVPSSKSILISDDPFRDFNKLINHFKSSESAGSYSISMEGGYYIGTNTKISPGVDLFPGVVIGDNVTIGQGCIIYPNVVIYNDTMIGKNVIIHAGSVIGSHAYYYKNRRTRFEKLISCGRTIIEDDVEIGSGCTIDKGVSGDTIIGQGTKLDNQVHIGHGVVIGKLCLIGAQVAIGGKTTIEDNVTIWGQAGITKDVVIGKGAVISAQTGVGKSLEGGKAYFGTPSQELREAHKQMAWLRRKSHES